MSIEPVLTDSELIQFQDEALNTAKAILKETNDLMPMFFVLTQKMEIDAWLRSTVVDMKTWAPVQDDGSNPTDLLILVIPAPYDDPGTIVHMCKYLTPDPDAASRAIEMLRASAPEFNVPGDPDVYIASALRKMFRCENKDIIASFIRVVCKQTNAMAYAKVSEAWIREMVKDKDDDDNDFKEARKKIPKSLADDPESTEVLMSMLETKTLRRHVMEKFVRDERGKGKIISWGEKKVLEDRGDNKEGRLTGRFFNLLQDIDERKRADV